MPEITQERVLKALEDVKDPDLGQSIVQMGMVKDLRIDGTQLTFTCELTTPACPLKEQIEKDIRAKIAERIPEVTDLRLTMTGRVRGAGAMGAASPPAEDIAMPQVRNVILVGGGKGGTGKSTCAVNLALALKSRGAKVALLDADIYCPALHILLGLHERPQTAEGNKIKPLIAFGMEVMSLGFLVEPDQPMMWRGPVVGGIMMQFLHDVLWSENDYLIIDLPPGVGEVPLALTQNCAPAGALLVSTPQYASIAAVVRAGHLFEQMHIPVLGLMENMSGGIFGKATVEKAAAEMQLPFLGTIPLSEAISQGSDAGLPIVHSSPDSEPAHAFVAVAENLAAQVSIRSFQPQMNTDKHG
ncbi:MAG TPA: P-loop NTPase [Planctomycetota bacterium]|jgi:ATP-binding protein involved in chromosome partitioning